MSPKNQGRSQYTDQLAFYELNDESFDDGVALWRIIEPGIDAVLADFHAHLAGFAPKGVFDGVDTETLNTAQKQHLKALFTTFYAKEYVDLARRIAQAHEDMGLSAEWIVGAYVFLLNRLSTLVRAAHNGRDDDTQKQLALLNRLIGLDLGLAMSVFQED